MKPGIHEPKARHDAEATVTFMLRLPPELHQAIKLDSMKMGITIRSWLLNACETKLKG